MTRVLHIGKYFPPHRGGMETFLRDLMVEQASQGIAVSGLVHSSEQTLRYKRQEYTEADQQLAIYRAARWFTLAFAPISPGFPWLLQRCITEVEPDILHIHMPNLSAFWCLLLPAARRKSWVVHWHADVLASTHHRGLRLLYWLYRPFEQALLHRADRIIATSPPYLASSEPLSQVADKCTVVPLGIRDQSQIGGASKTIAESDRDDGLFNVLFIGRLTYYKGIDTLLRAVAALEGAQLTIVGDGELRENLERLSHALSMGDKVRFMGALSDDSVQHELNTCDCVCLPSIERTEAFGVVLLEAMRVAKATVATDVPGSGMSWVVKDQQTGLLVAAGNPQALADALTNLRDNPGFGEELGRAGRDRFAAEFRIATPASSIGAIYQGISAGGFPSQGGGSKKD